eukprot:scaffold8163_cov258-Pinguiococcus_pyrenoidosus.AAC.4
MSEGSGAQNSVANDVSKVRSSHNSGAERAFASQTPSPLPVSARKCGAAVGSTAPRQQEEGGTDWTAEAAAKEEAGREAFHRRGIDAGGGLWLPFERAAAACVRSVRQQATQGSEESQATLAQLSGTVGG